jgi:5-methylcytosine-specific restriction protein A
MPLSAPHACLSPGCATLVRGAPRCPAHTRARDLERGTAHQRGYDARWRAYRLRYLRENPLCVRCQDAGQVMPSTVVDHIQDHKGDEQLFWDPANHQALCAPHHNKRTDAGDFGR